MNQQLADMKTGSRASFISLLKSFFLYTFGFLGIATLSGFYIFNIEQTGERIIINLGIGIILSIFRIAIFWEKQKEELIEDQIESN